jgi:6-phosphogluconolactonase
MFVDPSKPAVGYFQACPHSARMALEMNSLQNTIGGCSRHSGKSFSLKREISLKSNLDFFLVVIAGALLVFSSVLAIAKTGRINEYLMYIGTYTKGKSKGIYAYRFNPSTGQTTPLGLAVESANPSFLAVHPNRRVLYAVNEVADYEGHNGYISSYSINKKTGRLTFLNKVSSGGAEPCHVAVDKTGKWLAVANYTGGSISIFPINENGSLGKASAFVQHAGSSVDARRQKGPHAHSVDFYPDNRFLLVSDLGLDKVLIYRFDNAKGTLSANNPPAVKINPGSGPRHLTFHTNGKWVYMLNEMKSTVTAFSYNAEQGSLQEIQTLSSMPPRYSGRSIGAEIAIHGDGKFLYCSNRGHDSITVFSINESKGTLTPVERISTQGKTPRHFAIDPAGIYLFAANQDSGNIAMFLINRKTGMLIPTGISLEVSMPVCMVFVSVT